MTKQASIQKSARRQARRGAALALAASFAASLAGCMVGPDYRQPEVPVPQGFKEGVDWQRADANPQAAIASTWWRMYGDDKLNALVEQSLKANQSIAAAEAAYRVATATIQANRANLFPVVTAGLSGGRAGGNLAALQGGGSGGAPTDATVNSVVADAALSWELDLWGQIRRQVQEAKANAQASDAQLAGERISIAASVATGYFGLRQADYDIRSLKAQQDIDARLLAMTESAFKEGEASNDDVLAAQQTLQDAIAALQSTETTREQDEHALAVLAGEPPASFGIAPDPDYRFAAPAVPLGLPSQLLERRYDVVSAERTAAAGNAAIGVAKAAFFPTLTLSAEGGYGNDTFAHLFSLPNRFWTLGPDLAGTLFDGGARTAALREARATYDEDVANYRNTVLTAFQNVDDSLSAINHLRAQESAYAQVLDSSTRLFASEQAQFDAGAVSRQSLLTQRLTLLQAQQTLRDTQALLAEGDVVLVKNLGGGWQKDSQADSNADGKADAAAATPVAQRAAD